MHRGCIRWLSVFGRLVSNTIGFVVFCPRTGFKYGTHVLGFREITIILLLFNFDDGEPLACLCQIPWGGLC